MRWVVEVMSLGKTETESLHVEAESWQKALQAAREQRGESSPMSGFSIELLDEGCRAIDPMSRLRYDVRKAPEDTVSTRAPSVRPPPTVDASSRQRMSQPPRPQSHPPPSTKPPHVAKRPSLSPASLSAIGQNPGTSVRASVTPAPPPTAPIPPAPAVAPMPAPVVPVAPAPSPGPPAPVPEPAAPRADVEMNVPSQIVFKREHDPTDAVPLTYREYVFLVPPGTNETAAEALLQTQLELVLASLARIPPGKLVNLGVFDVAFQGKPPVAPLATLMWKDWRGSPVVEFPRRAGYVPTASPAAPPTPVQPIAPSRPVSQPPPSAIQTPFVAAPPPHVPPPAAIYAPAHAVVLPPVAVVAEVAPAPSAPVAFARQVSAPSPAPQPRTRMRGEDLISELFESMHDLHFLGDAIEGGDFCLNLAMERIPSQAGLVHLYDINQREFLVTSTRGPMAKSLLLRRHSEGDAVLSAAMGKRRALVVVDAAHSEAAGLDRYVGLGGVRSLIVAPVMQSGRFLGAIELMNPLDGQPYTEGEGNALTYIAEQFAEFVASRGVVTDPARISRVGG